MTRWTAAAVLCLATVLLVVPLAAPVSAQQPLPERQEEYVPVDSLPQQEQMPAAPLLIAAYVVVLVAFFVYLFSVARRLQTVQKEIERLEADARRAGRG